jgi:Fe2+ transport system protein FeoA
VLKRIRGWLAPRPVAPECADCEICESCPLVACAPGWCATVLGVTCAAHEAHRLRTLGVYEGARVSVVDRRSGVLLDVCGTRLALNDALAATILVRPIAA